MDFLCNKLPSLFYILLHTKELTNTLEAHLNLFHLILIRLRYMEDLFRQVLFCVIQALILGAY